MDKIIKIILAILLLGCLLDMPYGYYQLVRFCGMIGFGFLAYQSSQAQQQTQMLLYGALALLFQPFFKIALGRGLWNVIDVIVAIVLIISIFKRNR
ncbi:MAG: hypothetical protein Q4A09_00590 [Capnocytophaga felis]|nr:hypothetical protein [Capnocytophaga felis]